MEEQTLNDYFERMEKSQQGSTLALGAVAEHLEKMNRWFEKQDERDEDEKHREEMEMEKQQSEVAKQELIKEISTAVFGLMKENMELHGDKMHSVSHEDVFHEHGNEDEAQEDADPRSDTEEVQQPLQAMLKELRGEFTALKKHLLKEHAEQYEGYDGEEAGMGMEEEVMADEMDDHESAEYPMEEDEYEEKSYGRMYKSLKKEFSNLKKGFESELEKKAIEKAEDVLQKKGWTKEINRQPRRIKDGTMGLNEETPIMKSQDRENVVDELKNLSWRELNEMRHSKIMGNTDGLPREVIEN